MNVAQTTGGQELSDAGAIGVAVGLGIWAFAWFIPTAGTGVLYLLFGRKST
jgi:hypothetical protein